MTSNKKNQPQGSDNFIYPRSEDTAVNLNDLKIRAHTYQAGSKRELHAHSESRIIFLRSGQMQWCVREECQKLVTGDVLVIPANLPHSYEVIGNRAAKVVYIIPKNKNKA